MVHYSLRSNSGDIDAIMQDVECAAVDSSPDGIPVSFAAAGRKKHTGCCRVCSLYKLSAA